MENSVCFHPTSGNQINLENCDLLTLTVNCLGLWKTLDLLKLLIIVDVINLYLLVLLISLCQFWS